MTYLFIFAHPDDETVACAATIKQLVDAGEDVIIVSATDGAAGEVLAPAHERLQELGSVSALRREELQSVCEFLNVKKLHILEFQDGKISNEQVWGKLMWTIIDVIDQYKPDVVITFDHSGWYFHLDHVGVSIATTLAVQKATHQTPLFFFALMKVKGSKWKYVFPEHLPITHVVDATAYKDVKMKTLEKHVSQNTETIRKKVQEENPHFETYQLVSATDKGKKLLKKMSIFVPKHQK